MDLLATVRKEGSRGGRGDFKWSDVESSSHRENYLGHSLMAPVGRWQKGRDLNWYAKGDGDEQNQEEAAKQAARQRQEEIRQIKEAEQEALARALGLPVAPRSNANTEPMGSRRDMEKMLKETTEGEEMTDVKGIGYGALGTGTISKQETGSMPVGKLEGTAEAQDKELQSALKEYKRRHQTRQRSRSRSRDRRRENHRKYDKVREHRHRRSRDRDTHHRRHSRSRERTRRRSSRSGSRSERDDYRQSDRRRHRSRSPHRSQHGRWTDGRDVTERSKR